MRSDERGLASLLDAVVFTVIVGLLVVNVMLPAEEAPPDGGTGAEAHDQLLRLRFRAEGLHPSLEGLVLSMPELMSLHLRSEGEGFRELVGQSMETLLGGRDWALSMEHEGRSMTIGREGMAERPEFSMTVRHSLLPDGSAVTTRLWV